MKRLHGTLQQRERKFIVECNICLGKGERPGISHHLECEHCLGSGWVCGHTLQTLPLLDVVQVLNERLRYALGEIAKARQLIGGTHEQYE